MGIIPYMGDRTGSFGKTPLCCHQLDSDIPYLFIKTTLSFGTALFPGNQDPVKDRPIIFFQQPLDKGPVQIHVADRQKYFSIFFQSFHQRQEIGISQTVFLFHGYFHSRSRHRRDSGKGLQTFPDFF